MEAISAILNIIGILFAPFIKALNWIYKQLPFMIVWRVPLVKLGIIESTWRENVWDYAKHGDKEVVTISTYWQITNTLPYNLTVLNVFLTRPTKVKGRVLIKNVKADIWGSYPIPRDYTTEIDASFVVDKRFARDTNTVINASFEIQDPTGRFHKINNISIANREINLIKKKKEILSVENPTKLKHLVERKIVSVLKNEVEQYKVRGRREGRLGTVEWPLGAIEWRKADDKISFLYENSNNNNVASEHIKALLGLYKNSTKAEQRIIVKSLLTRIDKKREYRNIAYLIIFFLFEINHLKEWLDTALVKLQSDNANAFGDVLRILDFLLAFRHEEFSEKQLDEIEQFVYSTKEHPFSIKERINAIRVKKMLKSGVVLEGTTIN